MGYTKKHPKFQIPRWPGSAASRLANYTKEILKNTNEKQDISIVGPKNNLKMISKMVGCIPEVLTLLLTPILTDIPMAYVREPYMS